MKNFKLILSAVAAALAVGCSDLSVNEETAYADNLPAGFDYKVYAEINPQLKYVAITQAVTDYNAQYAAEIKARNTLYKDVYDTANASKFLKSVLAAADGSRAKDSLTAIWNAKKDSLTAMDETDVIKAYIADSVRFYLTDSASLHQLFLTSWAGSLRGYTEADWAMSWDVSRTDTTYTYDSTRATYFYRMAVGNKDENGNVKDTTLIYLNTAEGKGKITYSVDEPTKIASIDGFTDTTYSVPLSVTIDTTQNKIIAKLRKDTTVVTKIDTAMTIKTTLNKGLDPSKIKDFRVFNFIDKPGETIDDIDRAKNTPLDSASTTLQYILVGKANGWAYRYCNPGEETKPRPCEEESKVCEAMEAGPVQDLCFKNLKCDLYPTTKVYCKDQATGYTHEI
ncbi:MAG: hypothetical protein HUK19_01215 [Fibrobacter sp.]|nr:hypothetical protein [Fibrobacter sp.]